ncbi:caprin-2-like protein [Cricetulus griseus]|nr:caprin-2-like protein [Cricetulus griseus]
MLVKETLTRYCSEEKMFGFHKPKMYRSIEGCCICRAKSSSSRFTDSKRYEKDFQSCFGIFFQVVDARAGPSLKTTLKPKKVKTLSGNRMKSNQISKLQKEFKRHNSDAHSTTSSASPAQSPCYSNQSDDGSDTEMASSSNRTPVFSFLDLTYWKRQKICCGIIYKGRFGEVLIDTHLFKPCCSSKKAAPEKPEEQGPAPLPISTQECKIDTNAHQVALVMKPDEDIVGIFFKDKASVKLLEDEGTFRRQNQAGESFCVEQPHIPAVLPLRRPPKAVYGLKPKYTFPFNKLTLFKSPSGHSVEGQVGNMKSAKPHVTHSQHGECLQALSPLQSTLSSASSPSQAYETYIDNGLICLKHKIRNIEKKKLKLEDYKDRLKNGEQLNPDQLEAVEKYEEVLHNLEFAKELQKTFSTLSQDLLKAQKKAQRREHMLKLEAEKKKLRTILQVQYVLQNLTQEHVQKDLKGGLNGAMYLPSKELDYLIKFSKLTCPERNEKLSVEDQMEQSSLYFWNLLEGSEKAVVGTTYKHVKDLLSKLLNSGYFENVSVLKNSKEKEEEMLMQSGKKKQLLKTESIKESESPVELVQPEIQPQEFLNRRYMTEVNYSRKQESEERSWEADYVRKPNLLKCWNMLPEPDGQQKKQKSSKSWESSVRSQEESVLDFDKPSSAIPSSQSPSASPVSTVSAEQNLPNQNDFLQEPLQVTSSVTCSSNACLVTTDQASSETETELMTSETSEMAVSTSKPASALTSPNPPLSKGFQLPPASGISASISTAPFQALQTVFNINAPLPPLKEQEMKESPCSPGYNQNFTSTSTQTITQCQLPAIHIEQTAQPPETGYHPDGTVQVSNGNLAFYPAPTSMFPRPAQPFIGSQASVRGCTRGGRLLMNPYRSPGGYKGFDSYRGPSSASNGNYNQLQLQAREYPGTPYTQRDNFQQCYKRSGTSSGLQANSKAEWSDSSQVSSPERDSETFNSGDSGQGDSRSMTPVDVMVTSPAAAILPVHVYPLPQQMRVAFSAARTSNLAPGTLDQPIVFDLLLNNLGETFDLQLGRFNCPVNGTYVFIFHMLKLAVNVPLYVNLMKNEEVLVSAYANDGAPDHETASNHAILQLLQGDQIWLRLHRGAIYGSSWKYSTFSGYLLYQD